MAAAQASCRGAAIVRDRVLRFAGEPWAVRLPDGRLVPHVACDWAATTAALVDVCEAVNEALLWYGSGHRGAGAKSQASTAALEGARAEIGSFAGARDDDVVVFVENTTAAINLLAGCLPPETVVVTFDAEHHSNLLPWRGRAAQVRCLPTPPVREQVAERLADELASIEAGVSVLVAMTGASNVTGELWPVAECAAVATSLGARTLLDAAQLVGHVPVDMAALGVDYLALSGHKMYAPFGSGVLVGRRDWLDAAEPPRRGGGAVWWVSHDEAVWCESPARHEAGSPNIIGAVALGAACAALVRFGRERLAAEEAHVGALLRAGLESTDGVVTYDLWGPRSPRVAIAAFNVAGVDHAVVARRLADSYGISVRSGCFCAHPLLVRLLRLSEREAVLARGRLMRGSSGVPGAVRASLGPATTEADVVALVSAVAEIAAEGTDGLACGLFDATEPALATKAWR